MSATDDTQPVVLDNEERRLINEFRRVRQTGFGDVLVKIHRNQSVALYTTYKWHAEGNGKLREVTE